MGFNSGFKGLTPGKEPRFMLNRIGGPYGVDLLEKRHISCPLPEFEPGTVSTVCMRVFLCVIIHTTWEREDIFSVD